MVLLVTMLPTLHALPVGRNKPMSTITLENLQAPKATILLVTELIALGRTRLGPEGAGPFLPGQDFLKAKDIVQNASTELVEQLLLLDNPHARANIARAVAAIRPQEIHLVKVLLDDKAMIRIQGTNDIPPNPDREIELRAFVEDLLKNHARSMP
jgi:hypothetical protein